MDLRTLLKFIFPVILCFGIVGGGYYFFLLPKIEQSKQINTVAALPDKSFGWKFPVAKFPLTGSDDKLIAYSSVRDPGGIAEGLPVRLKIPAIGVDSAIEDALITPDGRMDVPIGTINVAWFALGPHPGQIGSAVIGGHFGIKDGVKFVFYDLDKVKIGDKVYIVDDKNDTIAFVVRSIKSFDRNADATTVFTSSDGLAHLNIITCEGVWNQVNDTYPKRLVVFTDALPEEKKVTVKMPSPVAATAMPAVTISKLTSVPTQVPTILPSPIISSAPMAIEKTPAPTMSVKKSPSFALMLIQSARSLYATPIDGILTSLLLISIVFLSYKVIRRYIK